MKPRDYSDLISFKENAAIHLSRSNDIPLHTPHSMIADVEGHPRRQLCWRNGRASSEYEASVVPISLPTTTAIPLYLGAPCGYGYDKSLMADQKILSEARDAAEAKSGVGMEQS